MGSIHKHTYHKDGQNKSILLFVNPESYSERNHITLKISYDDGRTWPENKKILLDEYNGRGYSCITSVNENTIGILYESSQADMVFTTNQIGRITALNRKGPVSKVRNLLDTGPFYYSDISLLPLRRFLPQQILDEEIVHFVHFKRTAEAVRLAW